MALADTLAPGLLNQNIQLQNEVSNKASDEEALKNLIQQMTTGAQDFRAGLPSQIDTQQGFAGSTIRQNLAQQLLQNRQQSASHGFLHSGLKGAQDASARADAATNILSANRGIRANLYGQAQNYEDQAISGGLGQQQMQMNRNQRDYNTALDKRMQRQQMGSQIGGMIGTVGGLAAGGAFSNSGVPGAATGRVTNKAATDAFMAGY